jgi:hypothetical protein
MIHSVIRPMTDFSGVTAETLEPGRVNTTASQGLLDPGKPFHDYVIDALDSSEAYERG